MTKDLNEMTREEVENYFRGKSFSEVGAEFKKFTGQMKSKTNGVKKTAFRYLMNEEKFLEYAFLALKDRFSSRKDFNNFYKNIETNVG